MTLFTRLKRLMGDKKGNVLVLGAAAMPLIIGSAGLAIDTVQLSLLKRHLQRAADTAALAGAYARAQGEDVDAAVDQALTFSNAFPIAEADTTEPTSGTHAGRAVQVDLEATRSLAFMSFFTKGDPTVAVTATAALVYNGKYCMVALDESAGTPGITFGGSAYVNARCGVISNTSGGESVRVNSNGNGQSTTVIASPVAGAGGVPTNGAYNRDPNNPTLLLPYSLKQEDPFKDLPTPSPPMPCLPKITDSSGPPVAGNCYKGMDVDKAMTLDPGTYYITDDLTLNSKANITAHGVTLVFTSETPTDPTSFPSIKIDGSARLDFTAPQSGTYEGVIMHYDARGATMDPGPKILGNSTSKFEGAFYFPKQHVTFEGHSSMVTNCIQLVALRLTFEGNTTINNSCPTGGGAKSFDATWVRLVK